MMSTTILDSHGEHSTSCKALYNVPWSFDGHGDYSLYREDVNLWIKLTILRSAEQGPAVLRGLLGEAKIPAKTIGTAQICKEGGPELILVQLDKAFAIDISNTLDSDLADFFDYTGKKEVRVKHFIFRFHTWMEHISE